YGVECPKNNRQTNSGGRYGRYPKGKIRSASAVARRACQSAAGRIEGEAERGARRPGSRQTGPESQTGQRQSRTAAGANSRAVARAKSGIEASLGENETGRRSEAPRSANGFIGCGGHALRGL